MKQQDNIIRPTVPETVRTNRRLLTKSKRYRTRGGVPTIFEMSLAKSILSQLETPNGVMELSQPENIDALRWAHSVVNYKQ
jgi:hypothetical protein